MSKYDDKLDMNDVLLDDGFRLDHNRKLEVGERARFIHRGCSTHANGSATGLGDCTVYYCHKCGKSAYLPRGILNLHKTEKEDVHTTSLYVMAGHTSTADYYTNNPPISLDSWQDMYLKRYGINAVLDPVFRKGGEKDDLVVLCRGFGDEDEIHGYMSRPRRPHSGPKWFSVFSTSTVKCHVALSKSKKDPFLRTNVCIVEDPISAEKIARSTSWDAVALLGLNMSPALFHQIVSHGWKRAAVWTDDDWAGWTRGNKIRESLDQVMPTVMVTGIAGCKDPKDHSDEQLRAILGAVSAEAGVAEGPHPDTMKEGYL